MAAQVDQGTQLHRRLGFAEMGPREQGQARIDGRGVQRIDRVVDIEAMIVVDVWISRSGSSLRHLLIVCFPFYINKL